MLTLQQILDSDSISTLVAKLNANFQTLSGSNGGPQGIRGQQGIPGLPGRLGPTGVTGATGPTGNIVGIIPFAGVPSAGPTAIGPSVPIVAAYGTIGPWPQSAWQWLMYYESAGVTGGSGNTATHGSIYIDHANDGYWQYLTSPDIKGASGAGGYTQGGFYSYLGTGANYPFLGATGGWAGSGWYYYPVPDPSTNSSGVWVTDTTTYLAHNQANGSGISGPYAYGPIETDAASSLTVENARLLTKYGTLWITSGSDQNNPLTNEDSDLLTSTIGKWGHEPNGIQYPNPGRYNNGVDRLLFKMSLDGLPYLSNITARGFTGLTNPNPAIPYPMLESAVYPNNTSGGFSPGGIQDLGYEYWTKPSYGVSLEKYTPLLFLSERKLDDLNPVLPFSSLGIYMFTDNTAPGLEDNQSKGLFLFSSRYSPDPVDMFDGFAGLNSAATENWGELILDFRRVTASNHYVSAIPSDLKLSSDYRAAFAGNSIYDENNIANTSGTNPGDIDAAYRTYQGYISAINGKTITGDPVYANYWEYGLGDGTAGGPGGYTGGIHDAASGTAGMISRKTWYGSSVLDIKPEDWLGDAPTIETNNYIRVAGMMERGRRYLAAGVTSHFMSELIFYTSQFSADLGGAAGVTNDDVSPGLNDHRSLPSLYVSPYRNIGIGTFIGNVDASNDQGPLEPAARLHVHVKENDRENDPTYTWQQVSAGGGIYNLLPTKSFSVAAFSGSFGATDYQYNTDILIGNLKAQTNEYVNPYDTIGDVVNPMQGVGDPNYLRNAIRTESWKTRFINTLRFGAQPGVSYPDVTYPIGKGKVDTFKNEFQIALHPITIASGTATLNDSNRSITAVGIHNLYPRTRTHIFGKNLYNETEFGEELWTPGYTIAGGSASGITGIYPYYGNTAQNSPSTNQIALDYIGDSYRYPVGIYDYQYFTYGANPGSTGVIGTSSPNSAVYPNRESLTPTRTNTAYGAELNNEAWPSIATNVMLNGSYRHGGTANAWWEPTSYIGFNLFRDVSAADGHLDGDDRDSTRWILGTQGDNDYDHGNNGGAAIVSSPYGELGIVTIPRGRDGGHAYEQWEQRGLGTRDVLNNMKIVFDRNGNIAVGNAAGWDLDAYPSLDRFNTTGLLRYAPDLNKDTAPGTTAGAGVTYTYGYWSGATGQYGRVAYTGYTEDAATSTAAKINALATEKEYIRLEVGAEKGWSRDGRLPEKRGYGYPTNAIINIVNPGDYINTTATVTGITQFQIVTDEEGRISDATITFTGGGVVQSDFVAIVFPHPTEFNVGGPQVFLGFAAPAGALAMEWAGMNTDSQLYSATTLTFPLVTVARVIPTTDVKGSANVRLNNFVYGEGYGQTASTNGTLIATKRQESPKLIFTFLEATPESAGSRGDAGTTPYKKVNTVIQSAQTESPLREYFIPKSDNTGGTFMVFTDHMGSKEKDSGFDAQLTSGTGFTGGRSSTGTTGGTGATGNIQKLQLLEVVTCELLRGYTGIGSTRSITGTSSVSTGLDTASMGFARYFNKYYDQTNGSNVPVDYFTGSQYGKIVRYDPPTGFTAGNFFGPAGTTNLGTTAGTGATGVSVLRNIDYYYKIFQGTTGNYDNGWNNDEFENKASDIRFKRINSEYALVDFNITIQVDNPVLPGGTGTGFLASNGTIDGFAPRMTQSVKILYNMDLDVDADLVGNRDGWTEDKYGNGPWFSNWSSYRNWNTGAAQVGEDLSTVISAGAEYAGRHYGVADSPYFTTPAANDQAPTWNGNFIDAGMFKASFNAYDYNLFPTLGVGNQPSDRLGNAVHGAFDNSILNITISENLFGETGVSLATVQPSYFFMQSLRSFYSTWGNQTMGRSRNMMWRITPFLAQNNVDPNFSSGGTWNRTNTFMIEIVFDVPIMHVAHQFAYKNFGTQAGSYYKYLTLSGQSIVRYGKTETTLTS